MDAVELRGKDFGAYKVERAQLEFHHRYIASHEELVALF